MDPIPLHPRLIGEGFSCPFLKRYPFQFQNLQLSAKHVAPLRGVTNPITSQHVDRPLKTTFANSRPLGGRDYSEGLNKSDFSPAIDPTDRPQNSPKINP
jgi:hypothetical protein